MDFYVTRIPFGLNSLFLLLKNISVLLKVPEVIEDSGDALNLLWAATQPYLRDGLAGPVGPSISRSVVELVHVFLTKGGPTAGDALVASGAVAPIVHVSFASRRFFFSCLMLLLGVVLLSGWVWVGLGCGNLERDQA